MRPLRNRYPDTIYNSMMSDSRRVWRGGHSRYASLSCDEIVGSSPPMRAVRTTSGKVVGSAALCTSGMPRGVVDTVFVRSCHQRQGVCSFPLGRADSAKAGVSPVGTLRRMRSSGSACGGAAVTRHDANAVAPARRCGHSCRSWSSILRVESTVAVKPTSMRCGLVDETGS